jgi:hypothetical protein
LRFRPYVGQSTTSLASRTGRVEPFITIERFAEVPVLFVRGSGYDRSKPALNPEIGL